ncbi:MAG: DUF4864 domain-containing protein [Burkholderiaceae bacterium]
MFTIRFVSQRSLASGLALAIGLFAAAGTAREATPSSGVANRNSSAANAAVNATDRRAIEKVIREQLEAFGRDDARRAFAYASTDIQHMFRTADDFMRMVQDHYQPVYRAGSVRFIRLDAVEGQWVQTVQLVDEEGHVWRALFTMKRQADKAWRVGGCQLVSTNAVTT